MSAPAAATPSIEQRAAFDFIRYASVWEDADVLCEALEPVARNGRLLSIASAGDNALALLTLDPAEVVAVDLSSAQLACTELKLAAFRGLDDSELLEFLGFPPAADAGAPGHGGEAGEADSSRGPSGGIRAGAMPGAKRAELYARLRGALSARACAFWDAHPEVLRRGMIHGGKFERYFQRFRRHVLPWIHGSRTVAALRAQRTLEQQRGFYRERWDTWSWRALFRVFFSRFVMGRLGRDPEFFAQVDGPVAPRILQRTRHALTEIATATNPYLAYIVSGNFRPGALPRYARPEHRAAIRTRLERMTLLQAPAQVAEGRFHGMNLSDIFEYMSPAEHAACYAALLEHAHPGARLVYWNMLAPRGRPPELEARSRPLDELASALHARDRAWFYQALRVDETLAP